MTRSISSPTRRKARSTPRCGRTTSERPASSPRHSRATPRSAGLEDLGEGQANQFAMAKAIASGDQRLMQKAGLEAEIARLERLRAAHQDDQFAVRRQLRDAERDIAVSTRRIDEIGRDIERLVPTTGDAFAMTVTGSALSRAQGGWPRLAPGNPDPRADAA